MKFLGLAPSVAQDLMPKSYADGKTLETPSFSYTGSLAITTGVARWYNDTGRTLTFVSARASVGTQPTGASILIDIRKNNVTVFTTSSNRPAILAGTNTAKVTVFDVPTVADGEYLTIDINQIGSSTAGADLVVSLVLQ